MRSPLRIEDASSVAAHGARWGFTFRPVDGGTEVTESWHLPLNAVAVSEDQAGADLQMAKRSQLPRDEIATTLAAIKRAGET